MKKTDNRTAVKKSVAQKKNTQTKSVAGKKIKEPKKYPVID